MDVKFRALQDANPLLKTSRNQIYIIYILTKGQNFQEQERSKLPKERIKTSILNDHTLPFNTLSATTILEVNVGPFDLFLEALIATYSIS